MNKHFFAAAFLLGLAAVAWVATGFFGSHVLALVMTLVIAAVYGLGALELYRFRQATATLSAALDALAARATPLTELGEWLGGLHASLQNPVRLRVEGERMGLPGPALTPYLVGLLVMLGMLGTFLGMVVTLNGAVFALEGTADLQAIRTAFAAPIKGLGLAFGTSIAGVATSAMLGLMSAISRRDRLMAAQRLDTAIATSLRGFSLTYQRQESFKALQLQSQAFPAVVDQLQAMMVQMERLSQGLNERVLSNQQGFHKDVKAVYTDLAQSVDRSLRESLSHGAQAAGDSIRPVVEAAMAGIAQEAKTLQERMVQSTQTQLGALSAQFSTSTSAAADAWSTALANQERANAAMAAGLERSLHDTVAVLKQEWQQAGVLALAQQQHLCSTLAGTAQEITEQARLSHGKTQEDIARLMASSDELVRVRIASEADWSQQHSERMGEAVAVLRTEFGALSTQFGTTASAVADAWGTALARQEHANAAMTAGLERALQDTVAVVKQEWQQAGAHTLAQQQLICSTLASTAHEITEQTRTSHGKTQEDIARLLASSDDLVRARMASEAAWTQQHGERMGEAVAMLRGELDALREAEALRGKAAVERLGELQAALASHLTTLGAALEEPIARLIETASEAPRAAAEVIGKLRQEVSNSAARDNELLEERSRILATLNGLLESISQASVEQRAVIDALVASSAVALGDASTQFSEKVDAQADKLADVVANVTSSTVEVSALSESFRFAVNAFNDANEKLIANLQRIEGAMDKSMARSDEQLAYYVAQAREIMDLSILSQKAVFEELRQLPGQQAQMTEEVA